MIRSPYSMWTLALAGLVLVAAGASAQEKLPPGAQLTKVEVRPERVELKTQFDYRQLLLTGVLDNGDRVDLTRQAKFEAPAGLVRGSDVGQVRPPGHGRGEIKFAVGGPPGRGPLLVAREEGKDQGSLVRDRDAGHAPPGCP